MLYPNPRGSVGYGERFMQANRRDWGGGDYRDIITGVDALIARGIADPDRLAILGWSYGGYMTAWAITQTSRFKAAMVGAGKSVNEKKLRSWRTRTPSPRISCASIVSLSPVWSKGVSR